MAMALYTEHPRGTVLVVDSGTTTSCLSVSLKFQGFESPYPTARRPRQSS